MAFSDKCGLPTKKGSLCTSNKTRHGMCIGHYNATLPEEERIRVARHAGSTPHKRTRINLRTAKQILSHIEDLLTVRPECKECEDPKRRDDESRLLQVAVNAVKMLREDDAQRRKDADAARVAQAPTGHSAVA